MVYMQQFIHKISPYMIKVLLHSNPYIKDLNVERQTRFASAFPVLELFFMIKHKIKIYTAFSSRILLNILL